MRLMSADRIRNLLVAVLALAALAAAQAANRNAHPYFVKGDVQTDLAAGYLSPAANAFYAAADTRAALEHNAVARHLYQLFSETYHEFSAFYERFEWAIEKAAVARSLEVTVKHPGKAETYPEWFGDASPVDRAIGFDYGSGPPELDP